MERLANTSKGLSLAVAIALAGCGGGSGGSGSSDNGSTDPGSDGPTLTGSAAKGVMQQAPLSVYRLSASGERGEQLATARTDDEGAYEVLLPGDYEGGPLEVVVEADDQTRMICDAPRCGEGINRGDTWENLPADFELTSVLSTVSDADEIVAPVSAWTSMAANRARTLAGDSGDIDSSSRQASAEVSEFAGFDVARTNAKGPSQLAEGGASSEEAQGAVMNSAVAEIVFNAASGEEGESVSDRLRSFSESMNDGKAGGEGDSFTVEELSEAVSSASENVADLDENAQSNLNNQTARYDSSPDGFEPSYDPDKDLGDDASEADRIAAFQDFVSEVRTWARSVEDLDSTELSGAVQTDVDTLEAVFDDDLQHQLQIVALTGSQVAEHLTSNAGTVLDALENGGTETINIVDENSSDIGEVTLQFTTNDQGGLQVLATSEFNNAEGTEYLPLDLVLDSSISAEQLDDDLRSFSSFDRQTTFALSGRIGDENTGIEFDRTELEMILADSVSFDTADSVEEINAVFERAEMSGQISAFVETGESFTGKIGATLVRLDEGAHYSVLNQDQISLRRARLSGDFTSANGNRFRTSARLNVDNASTFDTFAWFNDSGEHRWLDLDLAYEDVVSFLPEVPEAGVRLPSASVRTQYDGGYAARAQWFEKSDEPITNRYGLSDQEAAELQDAFLEETSGDVVFETNSGRTFEVEYDSLFERIVGFDFNAEEGNLNITSIPSDQNLLEENEYYASIVPEESAVTGRFEDSVNESLELWEPEVEELLVANFSSMNPTEEDVAWLSDLIEDTYLPAGAEHQRTFFSGNEPEPLFESKYQIATDLDAFDACQDNSQTELERLVGLGQDGWRSDSYRCARATLVQGGTLNEDGFVDYEPVAADEFEPLIRQALTAEFGAELADGMPLGGVYSWVDLIDERVNTGVSVQIPDLDTRDNFLKASLTFTSRVDMPELQEAAVTATAQRSSYSGGRVIANVNWNGGNYSVEVISDDLEAPNPEGVVRFFNAQGYELILDVAMDNGDWSVSGSALIDDETVGSVEMRNGIPVIDYPDGDTTRFESLM